MSVHPKVSTKDMRTGFLSVHRLVIMMVVLTESQMVVPMVDQMETLWAHQKALKMDFQRVGQTVLQTVGLKGL